MKTLLLDTMIDLVKDKSVRDIAYLHFDFY